jgi:thiol-disulfide isomerase/thioredoxin
MKKLIFLFPILFFISCGDSSNEEKRSTTNNNGTYNVEFIDPTLLREIINNRNGKELFVNIWATWCAPCVAEFPDLVQLKDYYKEELDFIAISVDHPSDLEDEVIPFIKDHKVNFEVYIIDANYSEEVIELLSSDWGGAIPATFIFDKHGSKQIEVIGAHTFDEFKNYVDQVKIER